MGNSWTVGDVTITVLPEPLAEPPFARDDSTFTYIDVPVTVDVLRNDGDRFTDVTDESGVVIDLVAGTLSTGKAVRISMPGAVLEAGGMRVEDAGARLLFERHVTVVVQPGAFRSEISEADSGPGTGG